MSSCFACCACQYGRASRHRPLQTGNLELLVLGLQGAGKSLLMRQLYNLANSVDRPLSRIQPTVGVELYNLRVHRTCWSHTVVKAREVGGCMLPVWPQYYNNAHAVIYVVDITRTEMLAEAIVELHNTMQQPSMQGKAVCLVLSQHLPDKEKLSPGLLDHVLDIDSLHAMYPGQITVVDVAAATAAALCPLLQWVQQQMR